MVFAFDIWMEKNTSKNKSAKNKQWDNGTTIP